MGVLAPVYAHAQPVQPLPIIKNNELGLDIIMSKIMTHPGKNNELIMSRNFINNELAPFLT